MATYVFRAVDVAGAQAKGEVEADNKQAVTDQLRERGLIPLDISEAKQSLEIDLSRFQRVKPHDLTVATRQLATMVTSGMSILRCLYVLETQTESKPIKDALVNVRKDVEAGISLSDAFERQPKVFNELYVAMVRAGETGGVLEESLIRVADQLEKDDALRRQVKTAMIYPGVIITFALLTLIGLVAFVVPAFVGVFKDFGGELPTITKFTVGMSNLVVHRGYLLLGGAIGLFVAFQKWRKSSWGRPQWDRFRLKIPMKIGTIVQKVALARWSRTLSALTSSGVPILQAIEITGRTAGNSVVEDAMVEVRDSVKSGGTIAAPLKNAAVFPGMVTHMIAVGEETGALDDMLSKVADFYDDEVAAAVKALTSILEPVMIIVVGAIVGFIVISMYMPMFKVYDSIK
jgi:type IV pilus assembly protein PilC